MSTKLFTSREIPCPVKNIRPWGELGCDDQDVSPVLVVELKRRVLHGDVPVAVRKISDEAVTPARVALEREIFRKFGPSVFGLLIAIIVVSTGDDVRDFAVKPRHRT